LFNISRAADAITGCGLALPRCGVVIMGLRDISIRRRGSDRKAATPAKVLSVSA
jgi:hypothetical protein